MDELVNDTEAPPERAGEERDGEAGAHPAGVRRVLFLIAVLTFAAAIPYLVPQLEAYRPWQPGSPLPFAHLLELEPSLQRPELAGGGQGEVASRTADELLAAAPLPRAAARRAAQGAPGRRAPAPRVPEARIGGLTGELEEPTGDEMDFFYDRLAAVGRGEAGALARVSLYSESINGADQVTSAMRHELQDLLGDGGKGFVPIAAGWNFQAHQDVVWASHNWRTAVVNRARIEGGRYGLGGVFASTMGPGSWASWATVDEGPSNRALALWRVFYQAWPGGGEMALRVDGRDRGRVSLAAAATEDRVHELRLPRGPHEVSIHVGREHLRLYGVTLETDGPGVVVDGLMLIGASAQALLNFDPGHIATQVRQRETDLLVFWLGGNDVISAHFDAARYRQTYGDAIARLRAGRPEASCLVISVLDKGHLVNGQIRTRVNVEPVVAGQAQIARDQGCAWFDLYAATGGNGTMGRWYRSSPRLAVSDYTHLTEAGARVVGSLIARALLAGYDDFLAAGGRPAAE